MGKPAGAQGGPRRSRTRGEKDQLEVIFDVIGTPSDAEIAQMATEDARNYLRGFVQRPGCGVQGKLPFVKDPQLDILKAMLRFGVQERMTVQAALSTDLVKKMRQPSSAANAKPERVVLDFEKEPTLGEKKLREYFGKETEKFKAG